MYRNFTRLNDIMTEKIKETSSILPRNMNGISRCADCESLILVVGAALLKGGDKMHVPYASRRLEIMLVHDCAQYSALILCPCCALTCSLDLLSFCWGAVPFNN